MGIVEAIKYQKHANYSSVPSVPSSTWTTHSKRKKKITQIKYNGHRHRRCFLLFGTKDLKTFQAFYLSVQFK